MRLSVQVTLSTITDLFALHWHDTVVTLAFKVFSDDNFDDEDDPEDVAKSVRVALELDARVLDD